MEESIIPKITCLITTVLLFVDYGFLIIFIFVAIPIFLIWYLKENISTKMLESILESYAACGLVLIIYYCFIIPLYSLGYYVLAQIYKVHPRQIIGYKFYYSIFFSILCFPICHYLYYYLEYRKREEAPRAPVLIAQP